MLIVWEKVAVKYSKSALHAWKSPLKPPSTATEACASVSVLCVHVLAVLTWWKINTRCTTGF